MFQGLWPYCIDLIYHDVPAPDIIPCMSCSPYK